MNPILLHPTDILFFRDGRPMSGSLSGHGAAWPMPHVISHAFHAALHRADLKGSHAHRQERAGGHETSRDRKFGSLTTAGPFPVCTSGEAHTWFFPRPADAGTVGSSEVTLRPIAGVGASSLPAPLRYAVGNVKPPSKDVVPSWWSEGAWNAYLGTPARNAPSARAFYKSDTDFADSEHSYGIGIDPGTGTVAESQLYSASYLRLREGWRLGTLASAPDKDFRDGHGNDDLISALLSPEGGHILIGGQQRVCSAMRDDGAPGRLPLPLGQESGFACHGGKWYVKWILLTPAIYPEITENLKDSKNPIHGHTGGWLPNWVAGQEQIFEGATVPAGAVLLLDGPGKEKAKRKKLTPGRRIEAQLVAAITGKPLPVTGWALPNNTDRIQGGAKSTHLAVPAGAVYYFECGSEDTARRLAAALNWHGGPPGQEQAGRMTHPPHAGGSGHLIQNRRSSLLGEKGYGLGVCSTWTPHPYPPAPAK